VQQALLGCCLNLVRLIENKQLTNEGKSAQGDVNTKLCLVTCRFFLTFFNCGDTTIALSHSATVCLCAALLTHVVLSDFYGISAKSVVPILKEYETPLHLMRHARFLSSLVLRNAEPEDEKHLECIKAVFNFLQAVAGVDDVDVLFTLPRLELSQLVVRNPLFEARFPRWCPQDPSIAPPRGYIFKGEMAMVSGQQASLLVGSNDPVFDIWLAAMRLLATATRTCSRRAYFAKAEKRFEAFPDMSLEFLRFYREPLLSCLNSCGAKLTKNALKEATSLLALVSELCKRNIRYCVGNSNKWDFDEYLVCAKLVVSTLSKFLGATGNSQELFMAIHDHETSDGDGFDHKVTSSCAFARERLISDGFATVKHEAIKFSHYASGRIGRITKADFESSTMVPNYLKQFSVDHSYENDLERNCRLAVTSNFSLQLVRDASACLYQALNLIWRSHSTSSSFYIISDNQLAGLDLIRLVEPGLVVGYRPNVGESLLDETITFESLRFGNVLEVDTFEQTWKVDVLRLEGSGAAVHGRTEKIGPSQLVGVEDMSARIPAANLMTAPDSMAAFELMPRYLNTANFILILRWCHQQLVFGQGQTGDSGFVLTRSEQQIADLTAVMLGADLVLHSLNGNFKGKSKEEMSQLHTQIFELFADQEFISDVENFPVDLVFKEGRMKEIISSEIWTNLQQQVGPFVQQAWTEKVDAHRKQKELKGSRWDGRSSGNLLR
jgi:hypothetical protein